MNLLTKLSIRGKIMAIILVVTTISLISAFASIVIYEVRDERQGLIERSTILAKTVAAYSVADLTFGDTRASNETLAKLTTNENILDAVIYDDQGRFFNSLNPQQHAESLVYLKEITGFTDGVLNIYEPVVHEDVHYGTLHLVVSTTQLAGLIVSFLLYSLLLLILLITVSYLLAGWLQKFISTPILELAMTAEQVSESGDYTVRITHSDGDEVGMLYRCFNHMLGTIQQGIDDRDAANQELTLARDGLEQRVRERTINLENTNKLLNEEIESRKKILSKLERQAQIIDQIHDSVVTTDLDGITTSWNKGAENLFGYTAGEAIGRHISFVYPEDQHDFLAKEIIKPLMEQGSLEREVTMLRNSGELFNALLSLSMLFDEDGSVSGMAGYSLDITQRKQAEKLLIKAKSEADAANLAKSEFLSRMSHELRTPLNAVLGFSQILAMKLEGNEALEQHASEIMDAGNHLLELIDEVLDLSRIDAGKIAINLERVEVKGLLVEAIRYISTQASERSISMDMTDFDANEIIADRIRLKEVMLNLLSNAVKYNHENGSIKVACRRLDDQQVQIEVRDTGIGLSQEQIEHIFEPFSRLGAEYTGVQGTGIGLTIVKRLVELMGGSIRIESELGTGTAFVIMLPAAEKVTRSHHDT